LVIRDIQEEPPFGEQFQSIVISEVLEHLERPQVALKNLWKITAPGGIIFLNVPINSPAPDHIFLWHAPEEVVQLVENQGFKIEEFFNAPATGFTEEEALRSKVTINVLLVARKPRS
jgi:SAM-dependent methyltransferase